MKNKLVAALLIPILGLSLTGCGKEVDKKAVDAQKVAGTNNLYWFCNDDMLIVFEDVSMGDDQYEGMWLGGCYKGKKVEFKPDVNSTNGGATE